MRKIFLVIVLLIVSKSLFAQIELKSADISKFVQTFEMSNNSLIGKGGETILKEISESQFFLLGEQHYSPPISKLTNLLLPVLASNSYNNFAIELGPNSGKKMIEVLENENTLYNFNTNFFNNFNEIPFPFFYGKYDEVFLKNALKNNFNIWAIDQEYFSSHLFLIDEIYKLSNEKHSLKGSYEEAKRFLEEEFEKNSEQENYPMFTNLLKSKIIKSYFDKCNTVGQQEIISDLISSWEIYAYREMGERYSSNFTRMKYVKQKFGEHYKVAQKTDSLPKVFVKMGAIHLAKEKNIISISDLGVLIRELSYFNNTKATTINCFSRYTENNDGEISDYLDTDDGKEIKQILELAKKNKWVLIGTKPILDFVNEKEIILNNSLNSLLSGYDYILLSPIRGELELNLNYIEKN